MTQQDFSCHNPASNPTGDVPPTHYKVFMCDWRGKLPVSFHGTWYKIGTDEAPCLDYPTSPESVTFTRTNEDCEQQAFFLAPSRSPLPDVPYAIYIFDPLVADDATPSQQAEAAFLAALPPNMGGPTVNLNCTATTFTMSQESTENDPCSFHIDITGVSF